MWIRVRLMDGSKTIRLDGLSKLTPIEELREKLVEPFDAAVEHQRLFYKGKQLENGCNLFDYDVGLNDMIQIIVQPALKDLPKGEDKSEPIKNSENSALVENKENEACHEVTNQNIVESSFFKVGDDIDAKDGTYGAWFEAKIMGIMPMKDIGLNSEKESTSSNVMQEINNENASLPSIRNEGSSKDGALSFHVSFIKYDDDEETVSIDRVRPRAKKIVPFDKINVGETFMVNYNLEEPEERGFWYDCKITKKVTEHNKKELFGTLYTGLDNTPKENCKIQFLDEVMAIEKPVPLSQEIEVVSTPGTSGSRPIIPDCSFCDDKPKRKCTHCGCRTCGEKDHPEKQILCDECNRGYHVWCLKPPLQDLPDVDEWYCPSCKNDDSEIVKAGEKLKPSKKKANMPSAKSSSSRDWGRGMACAGRTKTCTIVPPNHFGPIPGIEVGMQWKYRIQICEAGVHRPPVGGIAGREKEGAFSIALSGGYEDDVDYGDEFLYTGAGGRDLSDNKRTAEQSCDQKLVKWNRALAINCAAKFNSNGAEASDWKKGKPVRVVRSEKGRKHSEYCPERGYRYDGIYKVVKYWPEKGKSGFLVWRYLLRRDDPTPAPWTEEGKKRIEDLGFVMQIPEGHEESPSSLGDKGKNKKGTKRQIEETIVCSPVKKPKVAYELPPEVSSLIEEDSINQKIWAECKNSTIDGYTAFLQSVQTSFSCICCQDLVHDPITTECCHNICKACLQRSFKAEIYSCPMCRQELGKNYALKVNKVLKSIMLKLFPGYNIGR